MNIITISHLTQFSLVFNDIINISGEQSEEIYHNMWCISLEENLIESITVDQLKKCIEELIERKKEQVKNANSDKNVLFYMWFDQQALQLRFNIISSYERVLPFECKIKLSSNPESILSCFINTAREIINYGDQIQFLDSEDWENEDEKEFILDVFVKKL